MDRVEWESHKYDFILKTLVQQEQFAQWLSHFFFLNNKLDNEYDTIYQGSFYVKFYELLTEGLDYATKVLDLVKNSSNLKKEQWYIRLLKGLADFKSILTETELDYIEYRRHIDCHIFQNKYEVIQENLRIRKLRKKKDLNLLKNSLRMLIIEHDSDKNIDVYLHKKLRPLISELYIDLSCIHNENNAS